MAKLRWTLVLLALGIGLPAVLIVLRATEALDLENSTRHETVAERVFDEMERSLSDFLVREEARPASDYALVPESTSPTNPLPTRFVNADEPFLLGWFVLPATGNARTLAAEPRDRMRIAAAMQSVLSTNQAAHETRQTESEDAMLDADSYPPAPGRTSSVGRTRLDQDSLGKLQADSSEASSTYEVLQNLNRAGSLRSERQSKSLEQRRDKRESASPEAFPQAAARDSLQKLGASADSGLSGSRLGEAARDLAHASEPALEEPGKESDGPVVDPLVGRVTPEGDIVLTRSAWQATRVERQGLVLDRERLVEWLANQILGDTGLSDRASVDFAPFASFATSTDTAEYRYVHRFAEPFDGLIARLDLEPLPGLGASRSIHALALLLAVALVIGLIAVDRMTRVVVEYAERRSDFVAAVSHELRTPLTAIRMYGEMLRDGLVTSDSKRAEYYATITDESERLSRLIDNVLEFSRLEQNRRESNLIVGDLPETVRAASEKLRAHAEREGFELALEIPTTLPRVRHDRDAVTQIVFNLVDNALKYARRAESKTIEIELAASDPGIELRVRDFGPGVPPDQLDRIFEPFYRIGEELTRNAEGTGIGLALVRELANAMGGSAKATRPKGGGLEIVVCLPAAS